MSFLHTVLAFVVVIGVLVIFHEMGHYLVARWCGVKVLRFSVGMGKVVWSRKFGRDQTEWALSLVPLGGYVKMLDARDEDAGPVPESDRGREFTQQSVGKRMAIIAAGPIANFFLAILILTGLYVHGMPEPVARVSVSVSSVAEKAGVRSGDLVTAMNGEPVRSWFDLRWALVQAAMHEQPVKLSLQRPNGQGGFLLEESSLSLQSLASEEIDQHLMEHLGLGLALPPAQLGEVLSGGAAQEAGLQAGDVILKINEQAIADGPALVQALRNAPGQRLSLQGLRQGQPFSLQITPRAEQVEGQTIGRIRAQIDGRAATVMVESDLVEGLGRAIQKTWDTSVLTVSMFGKMITGEASLKNITGPITIADYAGQTARIGWISFLSFMAFVSISLGIMNLLPIPVLDGGHLLYYSLELLTGRPVPERFGAMAQRAGLGLLVALMAVAVFNDVARLIG